MSTVSVTELPVGTAATAADVNATLSSWNAATAAGQIGGTNVAVEGVDRRTMSRTGHVIEQDASASDYEMTVGSVAVANATGNPAVIPLNAGASPMQSQAQLTVSASANLILHASVSVAKEAVAVSPDIPRVWCYLQKSTDNGATWSTISNTTRKKKMRDTNLLCDPTVAVSVPGIQHTFAWTHKVTTTGVPTLYRVAYETGGGNFTFTYGVIMHEVVLA